MEIWKDIVGYEGLYKVSNLGRIKSLSKSTRYEHSKTKEEHFRVKNEIIKKPSSCRGYTTVSLSKENKTSTKRMCRLVAIAFIPNPENKPQVNHIDGNKENDNIENLEWNTSSENVNHAIKNKLIVHKKGADWHKSRKVKCLISGNIFDTINDFAKYRNIDASNISRALSGRYRNNHNVEYYNL